MFEGVIRHRRIQLITAIALILALIYYFTRPPEVKLPPPEDLVTQATHTESDDPETPDELVLNSEFDRVETQLPILDYEGGSLLKLPPAPFLDEGCQGEWCGSVKSLALVRDTALYADADDKSAVVDSLKKGDLMKRAKVFVKTIRTQALPKNVGTIIRYESEGMYVVVMPDLTVSNPMIPSKQVKKLQTEEWLYLETPSGKLGWAKFHNKAHERLFEPSR